MMATNKSFFENGEADKWFRRNKEALDEGSVDSTNDLLIDWLKLYANEISNVLEKTLVDLLKLDKTEIKEQKETKYLKLHEF